MSLRCWCIVRFLYSNGASGTSASAARVASVVGLVCGLWLWICTQFLFGSSSLVIVCIVVDFLFQ